MTYFHTAGWDARGDVDVRFTITHNSFGEEDDTVGSKWTHSYDWFIKEYESGNDVGALIHRGDGSLAVYLEDGNGGYLPPVGEFDTLVKNGNNTWTYKTRSQIKFNFSTAGLLTDIKDRSNNTTTLSRDGYGRITTISDPNSRTLDISYASGHISEIEDPAGRVWEFEYSGNDLTRIVYPGPNGYEPKRELTYFSHNITGETDLRGEDWTYTYSGNKFASYTDPASKTWTYTYNTTYTRITDPNSNFIDHNYSAGKLVSVEDEAGFSDIRTYNSDRLITDYKDKREMEWFMTWDSDGNRLTLENPYEHVWTYEYNATNDLTRIETPYENVTIYDWDAEGNLETITNGENETSVTNTYDAYGLLETSEDGEGRVTEITRSAMGEITEIVRPEEDPVLIEYDDLSRPVEITDQFSNVTALHYDLLGRVYEADLPGGADVEATYDGEGNVLTTKDELNHETEFAYDARGLLQTLTNARGDEENYSYDDAGRLIAIENGRGYTREFSLLARGECDELSMPDGTWEAWGYNALGDVSEYDCNGFYPGISYDYDDCSRLTLINYPSGTDTSFTYDHDGRTTSMVDSSGTTSWEYDDADRLIELTTPQGVMEYTYNLASQRTSMTEVGSPNRVTTYAYDDAGRLESLTNADSETTEFLYDEGSRLTRMTREPGTYTAYGYDTRSRVNSLIHKKANNDVISSESYTWDSASNLESKTVDSVETEYTYDEIDQILTEDRSGYSCVYTYDDNGNRLTKTLNSVTDTYAYDDGDKLTSITRGGSTIRSFTYEKFGRMATSVEGGVTTTFAYDYESRLTSVTKSGMTTNTFTYNGLDTRVGKVDSGGTKTFKRDGAYVTDPVLSDGAATYTPGISEKRGSDTKYSLSNYIGSTTKLIEPDNDVSDTRQYDAFGNITSTSGSTPHPFGFAGQWGYQTDSDTNLQLLGHRYHDPTIGRFLTRDPIRYGRNWNAYCNNNPLRSADPDGLIPKWMSNLYQSTVDIVGKIVNGVKTVISEAGTLIKRGLTIITIVPAIIQFVISARTITKARDRYEEYKDQVSEGMKNGYITEEQGEDLIKKGLPNLSIIRDFIHNFYEILFN